MTRHKKQRSPIVTVADEIRGVRARIAALEATGDTDSPALIQLRARLARLTSSNSSQPEEADVPGLRALFNF